MHNAHTDLLKGFDDAGLRVELERLDAEVEVLLRGHLLGGHGATHAQNARLLLGLGRVTPIGAAGGSLGLLASVLLTCTRPAHKNTF
jgi:hypothetical protein